MDEDSLKPVGEIQREENATGVKVESEENVTAKKKIKKKKKPKQLAKNDLPEIDNGKFRRLGNWPEEFATFQTWPPTIPVDKIYSSGYPVGELSDYSYDEKPSSKKEKEEREIFYAENYESMRRSAEVHRQVRKYIQSHIQPGMKLIDLCQMLEAKTKELVSADGLKSGWGFPTGCSLNNCAAHYTPNYGDETILTKNDICKLDFGVHANGFIIDCAFSIAFDEQFDPLIEATQEGTNTGIKAAGIDAVFADIGSSIQEVIESYEAEIKGKVYSVKAIRNLCGHSIDAYRIHAGKSVPIVKGSDSTRMLENECYAIETFASTGRGYVVEGGDHSHFMRNYENPYHTESGLRLKSAKSLLHAINTNFSTLAFCRRWLDDLGQNRHLMALKSLVDIDIVKPYPPLMDVSGSYTSQMEHTILLRPSCKEILSRGPDY